ncbi:MAG: hypothetical protein KAT75_02995, partial [Dehalococcoidia bacterium]|nr:hypothetical protein [Dehalococcoidia bacterium]
SKMLLRRLTPRANAISIERSHLKHLVLEYIPQRIGRILTGPYRAAEARQLLVLISSIVAVGLGFVYGYLGRAR